VDSHTAKEIVNQCLLGPLMAHRTIVLVTHHTDLVLPIVGWVVKLHEGRVEVQGTVAQLRDSGALSLVREGQKVVHLTEKEAPVMGRTTGGNDLSKPTSKLVENEAKSTCVQLCRGKWLSALTAYHLTSGTVKLKGFAGWSESYDGVASGLLISGGWLGFLPPASQDVLPYLLVSVGIHIDAIDGGIQDFMIQVIRQVVALTIAAATIVYVVPLFIVPAIAIAGLHVWFAHGYVNASRDLRRIESNTRSPIMSSFSELIMGITTVRAFGSERTFLKTLYERLDRTQAASHLFWMCNRWLVFRFDVLGGLSILMATIGSLMSGASAGLAGVVIVQAQQFVRGLYMSIRVWTELEQSFNSVERIQEYLDLPSEPPMIIESSRPPAAWPSATTGTLVVKNLVIQYAPELDSVLNGISFETKPSEKIGIVGRTGSGKSTLALALFRFVDPTTGSIILDGVDMTTIGVEDWRPRLTLIPQDVILFNGTIRENL
ncbi:hypothetical protein FRC06_007321, partial [Ceratobasidium sp. 370]